MIYHPTRTVRRVWLRYTLHLFLLCLAGSPFSAIGQESPDSNMTAPTATAPGLFDSDEVIDITFRGEIRSLRKDRNTEDPQYYPIEVFYRDPQLGPTSIPLKAKTRGHFRRQMGNCSYPPIRLNFSKKNTPEGSIFAGQDKLKLTTPCRSDQYVVREYLAYRIYNLVTDKSFRVRLIRMVFEDMEKGKTSDPMYGFILEDEDEMARRNQHKIIKQNKVRPKYTHPDYFLKMAVFEYLIGNTDWSTEYRHNIKLITDDSTSHLITVPYDFDHAGIVSTPYANPAPALELKSVRERRFRGYCMEDLSELDPVIDLYNELKEEIYAIYEECTFLDKKSKKFTLDYLDEFYELINDPKAREEAFGYPCRKDGTGNVIIRGLRK